MNICWMNEVIKLANIQSWPPKEEEGILCPVYRPIFLTCVVGWMRPYSNPWKLWTSLYLEKGSLQLSISKSDWDYLNSKASVHIRKRRHRMKRRHVKIEAEIGVLHPQTKEYLEPPEDERGREGVSPRAFWESVALPISSFWVSGLENCERIHFCFWLPGLW